MGAPTIDPTKFIIRTNDTIRITIPSAVIPAIAAPVPLVGTGADLLVAGQAVCLQGDELPPSLRVPLSYTAPPYTTPGTGTLTVMVMPANLTKLTNKGGKPILLKGTVFQALFTVSSPATQPTAAGPVPDGALSKPGTAEFITTNSTVMAS